MHIPDGFIAPVVFVPAGFTAVSIWLVQLRRLRSNLRATAVPLLAALAAAMFVLMMIALPLPGGTSVHASGVALLALRFSLGPVDLLTGVVLFLQAVVFGQGGITTLGVNAIALGLVGGAAARGCLRLPVPHSVRAALAGVLSVLASAFVTSIVLGLQPLLGKDAAGNSLYFPFPLRLAVPAVMGSHVFVAMAEGFFTLAADRLLGRMEASRARR